MSISYRQLKNKINSLFDLVPHSSLDSDVAPEDVEALKVLLDEIS